MDLYVRRPNDVAPEGQADPYVIEANGKFYVYATHSQGVQLYRSDYIDKGWEYLGLCYKKEGEKEYWAPSVLYYNGKYYMYYSSMKEGETDVHTQRLQVAVADTPEGEWKYCCELLPPFSIDAHVVNTDSGLYIFYCNNDWDAPVRAGTYILLDKMTDPLHVEGKPVSVVRPSLDEELFEKDRFKKGQHWYTIEGAFYFKDGDWHYLMYSGSCYQKETYFIGYATANGETDDLRKLNFKKYPDENTYAPLVRKNEFVEGTGHNSVLYHDGKYYIFYHGRTIGEEKKDVDTRTFRMDEMKVENGKLLVNITK